jgi:hypothetical protein
LGGKLLVEMTDGTQNEFEAQKFPLSSFLNGQLEILYFATLAVFMKIIHMPQSETFFGWQSFGRNDGRHPK